MAVVRAALDSLRSFGAVFGNPVLRRLQLAGIGSTLGTWAYGVGIAVYAYHAGGARAVGLLYGVRWGAAAVAAPWLGLIPDRMSRRRVMLAVDAIRTALLAGMAALTATGAPSLPVYALAVAGSIVSTMFSPAQGALLPSLVETPEELTAANAVASTVGSVGMFAGPAVAGIVLALAGPSAVFAVTAAGFLWSALCVLAIPADAAPGESDAAPIGSALVAGFRAIAAEPALRVVIGLTSAQTAVAGACEVLLVVVAFRFVRAGSSGVGWLNTAIGVGALVGVVAVAALAGRKRLAGDVGLGVLLWGVPLAVLAAWSNLGFALVLFGVTGLGNTVVDVAGITLMQRSTSDEVLGRVFAVLESLALATIAIGALVTPALVSWLGVRGSLVAVGAFLPGVLLPVWPLLRRIDAGAQVAREPLELLRAIDIFAPLPVPVLERLASLAVVERIPAGGEVFRQGDRGDRFYVVADGTADVEIDGAPTRALERGEGFGEIALLRDVPRTATVRALDELRLYALERDDFIAAVTGHAPSREAADSVVAARLPADAAL